MEDTQDGVEIRFGRRHLAAAAALALVAFHPGELSTEQLTMTTYYPSPYGVYDQMRSQNDTYLAYTGGRVGIGTVTPAGTAKMQVVGGALIDNISVGHSNTPTARIDLRNGDLAWADGRSRLTGDQGGSIELGASGGGPSGSPYIDFHYLGSGSDYSARIINYNNGLYIHGGGGGDLQGYFGNSCRMTAYSFGSNTNCPANWAVYSYADGGGIMFNSPGGASIAAMPTSGQMLCCKMQPY